MPAPPLVPSPTLRHPPEPRRVSQQAAVSIVYVTALFMTIMDSTIVNVALPAIGRQFRAPAAPVAGVSIWFLVSLAVFICGSGWLGDRCGGKPVLLTAIAIFTGASVLCGTASTLTELDVFRVLQGAGGGLMTPVGLAMLFRVYSPDERIRVAAILAIPTTLAPALGPVIGGLLITTLSWRWVFWVNLPIGVAVLIFGLLFLDRSVPGQRRRLDLAGFGLGGAGLGALMYGISVGPHRGWGSAGVLITVCGGALLLAALVPTELRSPAPLIDLRLLTGRRFRSASTVMLISSTSFIGALYLASLFYQETRGLSALAAGLSIFPEALGVMIGGQLASRVLYRTTGPRRTIAAGLLGVAASTALMSLIGTHTSLWWLRLLMFTLGLAMGQVFVPAQTAAFTDISDEATGRASTLFNVARQAGGAVGIAALSSVLATGGLVVGRPSVAAFHAAFLIAAALAALAMGAALAIPAGAQRPRKRISPPPNRFR
jgi:EmrB/QacA subfamily drug resistance transporter